MNQPRLLCLLIATGAAVSACSSATVTTTVLPPHRIEQPICPLSVIVHDNPGEIPAGGRVVAQLRVQGEGMGVTGEKIRRRLREAAAKLGANRVLATEITTPSTLAALGMTLAEGWSARDRNQLRNEALEDPQRSTQATAPPPTDPSFYGRGLAYAIFVPEDTLRTKLECGR